MLQQSQLEFVQVGSLVRLPAACSAASPPSGLQLSPGTPRTTGKAASVFNKLSASGPAPEPAADSSASRNSLQIPCAEPNYLRNFKAKMPSKPAPSSAKEAGSGMGVPERSIVRLSLPAIPEVSKITYWCVTE